nr:PsbP-related protein [Methanobacterium formicicum]
MANGTSLDQVKSNDIYLKTGTVINETNRSVDGVQATVIDIDEMAGPERGKLGEVKLVLLSKDDYIYTITFVTGGTLEKMKGDIDHILNSFQTGKS